MKFRKVASLSLVPVLAYTMAGCLGETSYTISAPAANATYVGTSSITPPIDNGHQTLPDQLVITYDTNPGSTDIYLNGQQIEKHFNFSPTSATASFDDVRDFLRQGQNTLVVSPLTLGPSITFNVDTRGPRVVVEQVEYSNPSDPTSGTVTVTGSLNDASAVSQIVLKSGDTDTDFSTVTSGSAYAISTDIADKNFVLTVDANNVYEFAALDVHGFGDTDDDKTRFLRDGVAIDPLMDVRIDEKMFSQLTGFISDAGSCKQGDAFTDISTSCTGFPPGTEFLDNLKGITSGVLEIDINALYIQNMRMDGLTVNDDGDFVIDVFMHPQNTPRTIDTAPANGITHNNGAVDGIPDGLDITIDDDGGVAPEILNQIQAGVVVDVGITALGFIPLRMLLILETVDINAKVEFEMVWNETTQESELTVVVEPVVTGNTDDAIELYDLKMPDGSLTGILEPLLRSGGLNGTILTTIQGALDENLKTLKFPLTFGKTFEDPAAADDFGITLLPKTAGTNAGVDDAMGNLTMDYIGVFETLTPTPGVPAVLGSYYVSDAGLPSADEVPSTGDFTSLAVSVNANMINQFMLALYQAGLMHFTVITGNLGDTQSHFELAGESMPLFFGPNPVSDDVGDSGALRMTLTPSAPPIFRMKGEDTAQATITYIGAEMTIEQKHCEEASCSWNTLFAVNLDIEAGVLMRAADTEFFMTIDGNPVVEINSVTDNLGLPFGLSLDNALLQNGVNLLIAIAIPQVAETELRIDVSTLCEFTVPDYQPGDECWSELLTTDSISAEGGHLSFKMGVYLDQDGDGVEFAVDNCPFVANADQADGNNDGEGDACEPNADGDAWYDDIDNCVYTAQTDQTNSDGGMHGDACDYQYAPVILKNDKTNDCMGANGTNEVDDVSCDFNNAAQKWVMQNTSGDQYKICNSADFAGIGSSYCLYANGLTGDDAELREHSNGDDELLWKMRDGGPVRMENVGKGDCIYDNGSNIALIGGSCGYSGEQYWNIYVNGDSRYPRYYHGLVD